MKAEEIVEHARRIGMSLRDEMSWRQNEYGGGYWQASDHEAHERIVARATGALDFLRNFAGTESFWLQQAEGRLRNKGENQSTESGARAVGQLLIAWAEQVESGVVEVRSERATQELSAVSTDIMFHVRRLNADREAHPAASIVLCGAALEISLRILVEARGLVLQKRPSISSYASLLREHEVISVQDIKDLEQCAGLRNSAAHGLFDEISRERSGLMEQQTNIMLRRLADLM